MKVCLVTSSGGHLLKSFYLKPWWGRYQRIWVTRNDPFTSSLLKGEVLFPGYFPEQRNVVNFLRNFFLAYKILTTHKPNVVFSTGAGVAVPFFIVAKLLGIQTIFMETFIFICKATLTGKLVYHLTDTFIVQHPDLLPYYPKAKFVGSLL